MKPILSEHFQQREPSDIRLAQIEFMKRAEPVEARYAATLALEDPRTTAGLLVMPGT